jgi:DNA-binding SARP family transcriptional activator
MLRIRVVGGLTAEVDGRVLEPPTSRRAWALLGWLALHAGLHSRADVSTRLWPDVLDISARQSLRSALWSLRTALDDADPGALIASRDRVGLRDDVDVDVRRFRVDLAAGRLTEAASVGDGDLLAGLDDEWVLVARDEHRQQLVGVLSSLSAQAADSGDLATAISWARRATALDPLSEESARALMTRLAAAGDGAAALTAYRRLADRLRRELRVPPSEPTWQLAEQLRTQVDRRPAPASAPAAPDPAGPTSGLAGPTSDPTTPTSGPTGPAVGPVGPAGPLAGPTGPVAGPTGPAAPAARLPRPGALPLVGRSAEIDLLDQAWAVAGAGHGGLALVHGDPGIGKSRLITELCDRVRGSGGRVASGAAPDLAGAPLTPWAEVCTALVRQLGGLPTAAWVSGLAPLLPTYLPGSPPSPPGHEQARLSESVVALLDRACAGAPLLVVIEDLHAADVASLTLLSYVIRRMGDSRVMVVATRRERPVRDELATLEQAQRQRGLLLADVALAVLGDEAVSQLARAVGQLDPDCVAQVVDVAEGNALIAVEAARALAGGRPLPVGLRDAVRAAAARLPEDARVLLRTVAVAGRDLDLDEAEHRSGVSVESALPPAEDEGLIVSVDGRLRFRHSLLREAVYADISSIERRERHLSAAAALSGSIERTAEAAAHLQAAGRTGEAGRMLVLAAAQARSVGALADATVLLRQALEALPGDPGPALELADVLAWRGRPADARTAFDQVLPLLEAAGDPEEIAAAHLRFADWHFGPICQPRVAVRACRKALAVLDGAGVRAPVLRAEVLAVLAWCEAIAGDQRGVEQALAQLAGVAGDPPDDPLIAGGADRARSFLLLRQARFAEAVAPAERAADAGDRAGRPDLVYSGLINAAFGLAAIGAFEEALALVDRAADAVRDHGMLAIETLILLDRAWILARLGRLDDAASAAAQARRSADRLDAPDLQATVDAERGRIALRAGEHAAAVELLEAALAVEDASIGRPLARLQLAEALARLARADDARAELARVVLEPVRPGDWPDTLVARMAGVQGLIARLDGDRALAEKRLREAADGWRRRLSAIELADRMAAVMADLGRPVIGLVVPAEELATVEADLAGLIFGKES